MKKEKYTLSVKHIDTVILNDMELSESQYISQLEYLCSMIYETKDDEISLEHREKVFKTTIFYEFRQYFISGNCSIILSKYTERSSYF